ncbi:unnamed protein product [Periconia digitata]|uniref:Uncharacterized protein n=1 Tax=Periconia digitata TaxID=1303443 RepID=A0A9W4U1T7_9PLEO|nr:unnamed protein product [Periconia digitata]
MVTRVQCTLRNANHRFSPLYPILVLTRAGGGSRITSFYKVRTYIFFQGIRFYHSHTGHAGDKADSSRSVPFPTSTTHYSVVHVCSTDLTIRGTMVKRAGCPTAVDSWRSVLLAVSPGIQAFTGAALLHIFFSMYIGATYHSHVFGAQAILTTCIFQ